MFKAEPRPKVIGSPVSIMGVQLGSYFSEDICWTHKIWVCGLITLQNVERRKQNQITQGPVRAPPHKKPGPEKPAPSKEQRRVRGLSLQVIHEGLEAVEIFMESQTIKLYYCAYGRIPK